MAKKVAVPSMVGTNVDSAETALTDSGLGVVKRYVSGEPDGTVYAQEPRFPSKLAKGEVVTLDILRAPKAPAPVDLSAVTKSIDELNKRVAELKASLAELKVSNAEVKRSIGELNSSVGEVKGATAEIKKAVADHHSGEGHHSPAAAKAAAKPVEPSATDRSPAPAPPSPPSSTDKPAGDA